TWRGQDGSLLSAVLADAVNPDVVYYGVPVCSGSRCTVLRGSLQRSSDGGGTFRDEVAFEAPIVGLSMSADGGGFWLVTRDGMVHHSGDHAASWEPLGRPPSEQPVVRLSASPHNPQLVYVVT